MVDPGARRRPLENQRGLTSPERTISPAGALHRPPRPRPAAHPLPPPYATQRARSLAKPTPRSPSLPRAPSTPAPPAQRFVLPVARAELDEDGRGGGGVAGEDELLPRPPRGSSLLHVEGVEVDVAPRRERPEVEEREAVAHEVRQQVLHLERAADPRPLDAIEAVVELRLVGAVPEVPGHAQGDTIL